MLSRLVSKSFIKASQHIMFANKSTGTVKIYFAAKGFGFITPDDGGAEVFVHQSNVKKDGFRSLLDGEQVEYDVEEKSDSKLSAVNVTGPGGADVQGQARGSPMGRDGDRRGGGGGRGGSRGDGRDSFY